MNRKTIAAAAAAITLALAGCGSIDTTALGATTSKASKSAEKKTAAKKTNKSTEPNMTKAEEQAVGSAEDYLSYQAFSKSGLIEQLKFEGFSKKDATFAVNHINVNWKKQAAKSAENYLEMQHFSRSGLIDQLQFEGFTEAQAEYGVDKAGL